MRYLLDTSVVSDLVRHPQGRISERIRKDRRGTDLHQHHRRRGITLRSYEASLAETRDAA